MVADQSGEIPSSTAGSSEVGHTHADLSGGWLRPAVFGAMDGLVTNIALMTDRKSVV